MNAPMDLIGKRILVLIALLLLLYWGKTLFIPLGFGLLLALIFYPACAWLEKKGLSKSVAITICILAITLLAIALLGVFLWQVSRLRADLPQLTQKFTSQWPVYQQWIVENLRISIEEQEDWVNHLPTTLAGKLGTLLSEASNGLFMLFIAPVFMALFLYHRRQFVKALMAAIDDSHHAALLHILQVSTYTYFRFVRGMVLVYLIVGICNTIGLWALGIEHALLFGMLCAVMTIIPYVGIMLSALLPVSLAWLNAEQLWLPLAVIAMFAFVQYLEANIIFPKVVGSELNISTWATLVAIIAGGILWGMAGMILFIPFLAILKIVTDHIPSLRALNLILTRNE
jgi:predicted PurR-regulated permease PerM